MTHHLTRLAAAGAATLGLFAASLAGAPSALADDDRKFAPTGDEIHASSDQTNAPVLAPGLHQDAFSADDGTRYYQIKRSPGSTLHVSLTGLGGSGDAESWKLAITTPGGTSCQSDTYSRSDTDTATVGTLGLMQPGPEPGATPGQGGECANAPVLLVAVTAEKAAKTPVEVLYIEVPALSSTTDLPAAPTASVTPGAVPVAGETKDVRGTGSFTSAPEIGSGTYLDRLRPGQTVFYRFKLDYGQAAAATIESPAPDAGYHATKDEYGTTEVSSFIHAPDRIQILDGSSTVRLDDDRSELVNLETRPVTHLSTWASSGWGTSLSGYYYLRIRIDESSEPALNRQEIPVRIRLQVKGDPVAAPKFSAPPQGAIAGAAEPPAVDTDGGPGVVPIVAGGLGLALLLGGLGYFLASRRR